MKTTILTSRLALEELILSLRNESLPLLINDKKLYDKAKAISNKSLVTQKETAGAAEVEQTLRRQ